MFEYMINSKWPKLIFVTLAIFNGLLLVAAGMIVLIFVETPSLTRLIYAAFMCNMTLICLIAPPTLLAFVIMGIIFYIQNKKEDMVDVGERSKP